MLGEMQQRRTRFSHQLSFRLTFLRFLNTSPRPLLFPGSSSPVENLCWPIPCAHFMPSFTAVLRTNSFFPHINEIQFMYSIVRVCRVWDNDWSYIVCHAIVTKVISLNLCISNRHRFFVVVVSCIRGLTVYSFSFFNVYF